MDSVIKQRKRPSSTRNDISGSSVKHVKQHHEPSDFMYYLCLTLFVIFGAFISYVRDDAVPTPIPASAPLDQFSEERAKLFLKPLVDNLGYRIFHHFAAPPQT